MTSGEPADLASATLEWTAQWLDPEVGLIWNPPGSISLLPELSVHLIPPSAWLALGLLARDGRGDVATASAVLGALAGLQYDRPGTPWHGTFRQFFESPEPMDGAIEWVSYDPNWRQFIGSAFALALQRFESRLDGRLVSHMEGAIRLAVDGEPPSRIGASYSNIALMKAWLQVEAGSRFGDSALVADGTRLAEEIASRFERLGGFDEYNSPTYYGIDLYALALWRSSPLLRETGSVLEKALWSDVAAFYHPGLHNLCGPFTRAYGIDMRSYAAVLGLWLWDAFGDCGAFAPLERIVPHGHDASFGPVAALLGAGPVEVSSGPRLVVRSIASEPVRTVTAWIGDRVMFGGESTPLGVHAVGQCMPATMHWTQGAAKVTHGGPVWATAAADGLRVRFDDQQPVTFRVDLLAPGAAAVGGRRWELPGLVVEVDTDASLIAVRTDGSRVRISYAPSGASTTMVLRPRG